MELSPSMELFSPESELTSKNAKTPQLSGMNMYIKKCYGDVQYINI